jgi:hypothetical protein
MKEPSAPWYYTYAVDSVKRTGVIQALTESASVPPSAEAQTAMAVTPVLEPDSGGRLDHVDACGGEHRVEGGRELGVQVAEQEPKMVSHNRSRVPAVHMGRRRFGGKTACLLLVLVVGLAILCRRQRRYCSSHSDDPDFHL